MWAAYNTAISPDFNCLKTQNTVKLDQIQEILEQTMQFSWFFTFFYFYFGTNTPLKTHFKNKNPGFLFKKMQYASKLSKLI